MDCGSARLSFLQVTHDPEGEKWEGNKEEPAIDVTWFDEQYPCSFDVKNL